ncbi:MAG: tetratricopeptide repeat protein [Verrucomicrobiales bacterium]|nr:tetratricopeptide repeat protein [Verrucomicrobiales bacterium]
MSNFPDPANEQCGLPHARPRIPAWLLAVLLGLVTVALYWPATDYDFVNYDDDVYVTSNVHVQNGLALENIGWAFLNPVADNWHPITVLSHMLVCQISGLKPWAHHLTNVLLHALNAVLVFALLRQLTGATWRSLLVAALFAVHPLHIQSVAWVSERKDVLSGFFGLLALIFYARYAQRSEIRNQKSEIGSPAYGLRLPASGQYWLSLFCFALGLMSKPMLVTLPFVMLLLDYWPLKRIAECGAGNAGLNFKPQISNLKFLILEKIPFFALAVLAGTVTFVVQKRGGSLGTGGIFPLGARCENALISYCRQLGKLLWPTDLAIIYPHPGYWPVVEVLLAGGLLLGISVFFVVNHRRFPFLLMGWLWFCGMLVPVIGLVQTGLQAMADRHNYLPSLGVFILMIWGNAELTRNWRYRAITLSGLGSAAVISCILVTQQQIGYWRDSETVFRHALAVTENNYIAHGNLGEALGTKGQTDGAIRQFQAAIRIYPDYAEAHNNLGIALGGKGQIDEAIRHFQEAIRIKPDYAEARYDLGVALGMKGQNDEAIHHYQAAIRINPDFAEARNNLGIALVDKGQIDEAIRHFQEAIRIKPDFVAAQKNLSRARGMKKTPAGR